MPKTCPAFFVPEALTTCAGQFRAKCPVCKMPAYISVSSANGESIHNILCTRCGSYAIPFHLALVLKHRDLSERQIANMSGYIRESTGMTIKTESEVDFLTGLSTPTVANKASKLLASIARLHPTPGVTLEAEVSFIDNQVNHFLSIADNTFPSDATADQAALRLFPALSASWAYDEAEFSFLLRDYLCHGIGLMEEVGLKAGKLLFKISPRGWDHLQATGISNASTGFVAMWFNDEMNVAWEKAIYPAIKAAGYSPLRIDKKEHNNKIDDEIMASIRGARFVVADFTGERGGVYFEAGYAGGLGKPVIWTVRSDWLNKLHFDTRQYNHITWNADRLADFCTALQMRIEATIGRGALRQ